MKKKSEQGFRKKRIMYIYMVFGPRHLSVMDRIMSVR